NHIRPLARLFHFAIRDDDVPPLLVVFVNGLSQRLWTNSRDGRAPIETVFIDELIPHIDQAHRTIPRPEGRILEGFSMGGYGAARIGFRHADLFGGISLLAAGPLDPEFQGPRATGNPLREKILAEVCDGDLNYFRATHPWTLAETHATSLREHKTVIRQAVGSRDFSLTLNRRFHDRLESLRIAHEFTVVEGVAHDTPTLLAGLKNAQFYRQALATRPQPANVDAKAKADADPKADADADENFSPEAIERLRRVGTGAAQFPPTRADVPLVLRGLRSRASHITGYACLAVEKMASQKLFQPAEMEAIWEGFQPNLHGSTPDTCEWSARALGALARQPDLLTDTVLPKAFAEILTMLGTEEPEVRRRGAGVARDLAPRLNIDQQEQLVRSLLAIPAATPDDWSTNNATARASGLVIAALASVAPRVKTKDLANALAARFLELVHAEADATVDFRTPLPGSLVPRRGACLMSLAQLAGATGTDTRAEIVEAVIKGTGDPRLIYSRTSGPASPPQHAGAEALAVLASRLTADELAAATRAIPPQSTTQTPEDYASLYMAAKAALSARRESLQRQPN
ncbi:MAG: alpha/beta hydrolase, partial [Planctomycetaceae bacterium]